MLQRSIGILLAVLGLAVVAVAAYGLYEASSIAGNLAIASRAQGTAFDASSWVNHWRISSLSTLVLGIAVVGAGISCARKRAWGLLLLAAAALLALATQWLLQEWGFSRYAFEEMRASEVIAYVAIALVALLAYVVRSRKAGT
jgi:hypothetical protein